MSLSNLKQNVQLSHESPRGDNTRHVVYIDRRLALVKQIADGTPKIRREVMAIISSRYPSQLDAIELLQVIAAYWERAQPDSRMLSDLTQGNLIRSWHMALIAAHVKLHGAQ